MSSTQNRCKDLICFSPFLYKMRNKAERFFNKAKQFRRAADRYDKPAGNYLAALKLVSIRIRLPGEESTPWYWQRIQADYHTDNEAGKIQTLPAPASLPRRVLKKRSCNPGLNGYG